MSIQQTTYLNHAYSHHNNTAEYQTSSIPFVKTLVLLDGNTEHVEFNFVTRFLVITSDKDIRLLFSSTGDGVNPAAPPGSPDSSYYFVVKAGTTTPRLEIKCRELWIKNLSGDDANISFIAGLTNVPYRQFPDLAALNLQGVG